MPKWGAYFKAIGEKPNPLVVHVLDTYVTKKSAALDFGAGRLNDAKYCLARGFKRVVTVDQSPESLPYTTKGIDLFMRPIESYIPEEGIFDFAYSCNTLFFLTPGQVMRVMRNLFMGLHSGGIFTCNVLGEEDGWVTQGKNVSSFSEGALIQAARGFSVLSVGESKSPSVTLIDTGEGFDVAPKFCHQRFIICRKP